MRRLACGLLLCGTLAALLWGGGMAAASEELDANRRELAGLEQQIEETLRSLRTKRAEAGSLAADLARLENSLERIRELTRRSDRELADLGRQRDEQQARLDKLRLQQAETGKQLQKRLVALYKTGQVGIARALLGATGTPLELAEKYAFLARIVRHDQALMATYRQQAADAEQVMAGLQALHERQAAVADRRRAEQAALNTAGKAKKQLLAGARSDESRLAAALDELRARAERLAELVKRLESAQTQTYTVKSTDFSAQRGRIPWPVPGAVRIGFGSTRHPELGTLIESNGLEITVPPQTPIKAVWGGRVLYASPLKGFGNLLVIDHGDKYYTLYAHAARFSSKVGDLVNPGEVIAFSGHEGRDSIYFEIRYRGQPVDPLLWLASR